MQRQSDHRPKNQAIEYLLLEIDYANLRLDLGELPAPWIDWQSWETADCSATHGDVSLVLARIYMHNTQFTRADVMIRAAQAVALQKKDAQLAMRSRLLRGEWLLLVNAPSTELSQWFTELQSLSQKGDSRCYAPQMMLFSASLAFREGDIATVRKKIVKIMKSPFSSPMLRFCAQCWTYHLDERNVTVAAKSPWKKKFLSRMSRIYFPVMISWDKAAAELMLNDTRIDLAGKNLLITLMDAILQQRHTPIPFKVLRDLVWSPNREEQGWRQRLLHALTRLKTELRFTMMPLFFIEDGMVVAAGEAFDFTRLDRAPPRTVSAEIIHQLTQQALSSQELARSLSISTATVKRHLKEMLSDDMILQIKVGRARRYAANKSIMNGPHPTHPLEIPNPGA